MAQVERLHRAQLVQVERREAVAPGRAQVAARALDPQHLDGLAREGILLHELGRGVAAPGVGEGEVLAESVGSIDEAIQSGQLRGFLVAPAGLDEARGVGALWQAWPRFGHEAAIPSPGRG